MRGKNLSTMRRRGFTLVEVMIVVLIIAILLTVAVPQFASARERSRKRSCLGTLRQVESAKEQFVVEGKLQDGASIVEGDLFPTYLKGPTMPGCPAGGIIDIGVAGISPNCTLHGAP